MRSCRAQRRSLGGRLHCSRGAPRLRRRFSSTRSCETRQAAAAGGEAGAAVQVAGQSASMPLLFLSLRESRHCSDGRTQGRTSRAGATHTAFPRSRSNAFVPHQCNEPQHPSVAGPSARFRRRKPADIFHSHQANAYIEVPPGQDNSRLATRFRSASSQIASGDGESHAYRSQFALAKAAQTDDPPCRRLAWWMWASRPHGESRSPETGRGPGRPWPGILAAGGGAKGNVLKRRLAGIMAASARPS